MKEFISSCAVIIVVVLIVEIFCPAKVMKKSLFMAFSLISLVVTVGGIRGLFNSQTNQSFSQINVKIDASSESILSTSATMMEKRIIDALKNEGVYVDDISLNYYINELSIVVESARVEIKNEADKTKTINIICALTGLSEGDISIWVNS